MKVNVSLAYPWWITSKHGMTHATLDIVKRRTMCAQTLSTLGERDGRTCSRCLYKLMTWCRYQYQRVEHTHVSIKLLREALEKNRKLLEQARALAGLLESNTELISQNFALRDYINKALKHLYREAKVEDLQLPEHIAKLMRPNGE